jgi:competence protein ComEC
LGPAGSFPGFAVAFGSCIVLYFAADHEPAWWAALSAVVIAAIAVIFLRRRPLAFVLALGLFAVALGFAVATIKATLIDHPILRFPAYRL